MSSLNCSPTALLAGYGLLALFAALAGGTLPTLFRLTHTRLQIAVSFVAGLMLGLSLLGLLPHAAHALNSLAQGTAWLLAGFLVLFVLQRFLPFHHHDVPEGQPAAAGHALTLAEQSARHLTWVSVALGLSLHSVFDGLAIAAAVAAGAHGGGEALGLGTALAVILHKPFGALAIITLMAASGAARSTQFRVNLAFALVTPLGALLFYLGAESWAQTHPAWLGGALAFCAGTFLCIACLGLLPELQFHTHDRVKLSLALLAGVGAAVLIAHSGHAEPEQTRAGPTPAETPVTASRAERLGWVRRTPGAAPAYGAMSLPVVVTVSLPCFTPRAAMSSSAIFLMTPALPRRSSTSRQLWWSRCTWTLERITS
jgi:zinc and cadmium transporter